MGVAAEEKVGGEEGERGQTLCDHGIFVVIWVGQRTVL